MCTYTACVFISLYWSHLELTYPPLNRASCLHWYRQASAWPNSFMLSLLMSHCNFSKLLKQRVSRLLVRIGSNLALRVDSRAEQQKMKCTSSSTELVSQTLQNLLSLSFLSFFLSLYLPVSTSSGRMPQTRLLSFQGRFDLTRIAGSVKSLTILYVSSLGIFSVASFHSSLHFLRNLA